MLFHLIKYLCLKEIHVCKNWRLFEFKRQSREDIFRPGRSVGVLALRWAPEPDPGERAAEPGLAASQDQITNLGDLQRLQPGL